MRLGVDATPLAAAKSGIGYHVEYLVRALAKTGELDEILLFANRKPLFDEGVPPGTRWVEQLSFPKRAIWMQLLLPELIRREHPDLTHYINFNAPIARPHPFVVTFHDMVLFRHPEFFTWKKRVLTRSLMPLVAKRALGILTVTEAARREIIDYLDLPPERVHVVPAAPADLYRPVEDESRIAAVRAKHKLARPYLLFVGTLEPRKNLPRLLQAFEQLKRKEGIPHDLAIVGARGWKFDPIFETVGALQSRDDVRFLDYVPLEEMSALYAGAELLVFPSLYEGFGVPPLEAMRVGTPVAVSDIPSLREVTGDASIKFDPFDVRSITDGMLLGLSERDRAARRDTGLRRSAEFTWDHAAEKALAVYRHALGSVGAMRTGGIERLPARSTAADDALLEQNATVLHVLARLPYVRLLATSAVASSLKTAELDLLVVAAQGRRACVQAAVALCLVLFGKKKLLRVKHLLDDASLQIEGRDLETARMLASLRPLEATPVFDRLLDHNIWMRGFTPDTRPAPPSRRKGTLGAAWQRLLEILLTPFAIVVEPLLSYALRSRGGIDSDG